jgi:hypothetical protein
MAASVLSSEAQVGFELMSAALKQHGLSIAVLQPAPDRFAAYIEISNGVNKTDLMLSYEFLSDLRGTKELQQAVQQYARTTASRMQNSSPHDFFTKIGIPINVEITWPSKPYPNRAASYVLVTVRDLRGNRRWTRCAVLTSWQQQEFEFKMNPFSREERIVHAVRRAVDMVMLQFVDEQESLSEYQTIEAWREDSTTTADLENFTCGKVYWLGFKRTPDNHKVWVADPWDAGYLGVTAESLLQNAQILRARGLLLLDTGSEFASAADGLLLKAGDFETSTAISSVLFLGRPTEAGVRNAIREVLGSDVQLREGTFSSGEGTSPVFARLREETELVIADVSTTSTGNPNVMYEIGLAHGARKRVVLIAQKAALKLPSDLAGLLVIPYEPDKLDEFKSLLKSHLHSAFSVTQG